MKLKTIKTRVLPIPRQDCQYEQGPVKILLADADPVEFCIEVPDWLAEPLGLRLRQGCVSHATLEGVVQEYKSAISNYATWSRTQVAKPVLLVYASYKARLGKHPAVVRDQFHLSSLGSPAVSLRTERALDVNGKVFSIFDGRPGSRKHLDRDAVVLPWTPELEASVEAIKQSLSGAIYRLDELLGGNADEVGAKLLASNGLLRLTAATTKEHA